MAGRPRTQAPPAPAPEPVNDGSDRSYGDHLAGMERPNLEAQEAIWQEGDARQEVDDRFEALERAQAEQAGIPYSMWTRLTEDQRREFSNESLNQIRAALDNPVPTRMPHQMEMVDAAAFKRPEEFDAYALTQLGPEHYNIRGEPVYTIMCDPPEAFQIDGETVFYHPDTSIISIKAVGQKRQRGFTARPRYPFLPKPHLRCQLDNAAVYGLAGKACDYKGRTPAEVEAHMQFGHPNEYKNLQDRVDREQREQEIAESREMRKAMVTVMERLADQKGTT